jgi:hypothetical protein
VKEEIMSKSALAVLVAVAFLVVGFVIGRSIGMTAAIQLNPLVIVGPDAGTLTPKDAITLHAEKSQQMTWRSDDGRALVISFPVGQFPPEAHGNEPFEDMTKVAGPNGKDEFVFRHPFSANVAVSPRIKKEVYDLALKGVELKYKYDQTYGSQRADGWIIIKK